MHLETRLNPFKLNTEIGNTNKYLELDLQLPRFGMPTEALMSNICTHNKMRTKLFANTNLHLEKKKKVKAVAELLVNKLFSILFLNKNWEECAITLL